MFRICACKQGGGPGVIVLGEDTNRRHMQPEILVSLEDGPESGGPTALIHSAHEAGPGREKQELVGYGCSLGSRVARRLNRSRIAAPLIRDAGPTTRNPARPAHSGSLEGRAGAHSQDKSGSHDPIGELGKPPRPGNSLECSPPSLPRLQRVSVVSVACLLVEGIRRSPRALRDPRIFGLPVGRNCTDDGHPGKGAHRPRTEACSLYRKH